MKQVRISRANFPGIGNFSWMNYFHHVLSKKYDVIIDSNSPDIVFYSNLHYNEGEYDYYTNDKVKSIDFYSNAKKIFITGEANADYDIKVRQKDSYCLGFFNFEHPNYLRFPTYVLDVYVLHNEGGMFTSPFEWLIIPKNYESVISSKKYFCSIVQSSTEINRGKMFDIIAKDHFIKSSGPWRATSPDFDLNKNKYHNGQYIGKIDGLTYRDKIDFFKDSVFNIAFQYTNTDFLTQEKIVHAYAGECIPIFYGNKFIEYEGFNPESFINTHRYNSFEEAYNYMNEIYTDKVKLKKMFESPIFVDNKLPVYFSEEYLLSFFEKIIQ